MADSTRQAEEMFTAWTEAQRKAWQSWLEAGQALTRSGPTADWDKNVQACKASMQQALDAQAEAARRWTDSVAAWAGQVRATAERENVPEAQLQGARFWADSVSTWAQQLVALTSSSMEAQKQLWDTWFDRLKGLDPAGPAGPWERETSHLMQTWQDSVRQAIEAQTRWAQSWSGGQTPGAGRRKPRSGA